MTDTRIDILFDLLVVYGGTMAITAAVLLLLVLTCGFTRDKGDR